MSEPLYLIPNLNEIVEEYTEREEEAVQPTQAETGQEENRAESRTEVEQPAEEKRKMKREAVEAETKQRSKNLRFRQNLCFNGKGSKR